MRFTQDDIFAGILIDIALPQELGQREDGDIPFPRQWRVDQHRRDARGHFHGDVVIVTKAFDAGVDGQILDSLFQPRIINVFIHLGGVMLRWDKPLARSKLANVIKAEIEQLCSGDFDFVEATFGCGATRDPEHAAAAVDLWVNGTDMTGDLFRKIGNEFVAAWMLNRTLDDDMETLIPGEVDPWRYIYDELASLYEVTRIFNNLVGLAVKVKEDGRGKHVFVFVVCLDGSEDFSGPLERIQHRIDLFHGNKFVKPPLATFDVSKVFVWSRQFSVLDGGGAYEGPTPFNVVTGMSWLGQLVQP